MPFPSLSHFIQTLEKEGELVRVREFVSPRLEIPEVADRMVKNGGKAILFENTGTQFPLLINAFASDRRICLALGIGSLDDVSRDISRLASLFAGAREGWRKKLRLIPALKEVASWMPKPVKGRGACQEVVMRPPDLTRLPVLTCWPADGGPFITLPAVHTVDPESGLRNLGMYRMQVFAPDMTGMHWHLHKGSAAHYRKYKTLGKRMPVTVTLGGDPAYTYAATAPLPENLDEYLLAGFLRKKRVEMVRCLTNPLEVPADVDFVIEGYVDPSEEMILEGPFGDHTGFYSLADHFPRFHVTCITHRRHAVYPATLVGIPPQEDGWIGKATERIFLAPIRMTVAPEIREMHMPVEGVFHNITLTAIEKNYPGQAPKTMNALWGAGQMMFNKIMVVTGPEVNLTDYLAVARTVSELTDPVADIHLQRGPVDILDHASSQYAYGSKIGIDATPKLPGECLTPGSLTPGSLTPGPFTPDPSPTGRGEVHDAITAIDRSLTGKGVSLLIVFIRKTRPGEAREVAEALIRCRVTGGVKFILLMDARAAGLDHRGLTWLAANNLDPVRDCFHVDQRPGEPWPVLFLDATRKREGLDPFRREWPNVTVMDDDTIRAIDDKWPALGLGSFLPSPSLAYQPLNNSDGAVAGPLV